MAQLPRLLGHWRWFGSIGIVVAMMVISHLMGWTTFGAGLGAIAALIAIYQFIRDRSSLREQPTSAVDRFAKDNSDDLILETAAGDVLNHLNGRTGLALSDAFDQLYKDRWVRTAGWEGTVTDLPKLTPRGWSFQFQERGSEAHVIVRDPLQARDLRIGDRVIVRGQLESLVSDRLILGHASFTLVNSHADGR